MMKALSPNRSVIAARIIINVNECMFAIQIRRETLAGRRKRVLTSRGNGLARKAACLRKEYPLRQESRIMPGRGPTRIVALG
jgi:hypothetical protein